MNRRTLYVIVGAALALLGLVVVLLVVLIAQNNAAADQAEHARIVAICEAQLKDPYGEDLDKNLACIEDLTAR